VLVKLGVAEEKTMGGILLPSSAQSKPQGGEIVAVGGGRTIGDKKVEVSIPVSLLVALDGAIICTS
jgi:chaperonin GroES